MENIIPKQIGYHKPEKALVEPIFLGGHNPGMPKTSKIRPEDVAAIAVRLKALRASTGLSQEAFANQVGLGYKQWGNFESAKGRIGIDAALTLVRELKVNLDWIYLGEEAWLPSYRRDAIRKEMAAIQPDKDGAKLSRAS